MLKVTTTKEIKNPAQLDAALGKVGVTIRSRQAPDGSLEYEVEANSGDEAALQAAIDAYVHDPNFGRTQDEIDLDDFLAKATPTNADVAKAAKAMARKIRGR